METNEMISHAEEESNAIFMEAMKSSWLDSVPMEGAHADLLRIASKSMGKEMAALYCGVASGMSTREQLSTALLLMHCFPVDITIVDSQDTTVITSSLVKEVLAPGAGDCTLVRAVVEKVDELISTPLVKSINESHYNSIEFQNTVHRALLTIFSGDATTYFTGHKPLLNIKPRPLPTELLRETVRGSAFDAMMSHGLMGSTNLYLVVYSYLFHLKEVYGKKSTTYDEPQFIANRSREFFARSYPATYAEYMAMEPSERIKVVQAVNLILSHLGDNMNLMEAVLDALPYLTGARFVEFASLVEEYNLEWAIASFDWSAGGSALGRA